MPMSQPVQFGIAQSIEEKICAIDSINETIGAEKLSSWLLLLLICIVAFLCFFVHYYVIIAVVVIGDRLSSLITGLTDRKSLFVARQWLVLPVLTCFAPDTSYCIIDKLQKQQLETPAAIGIWLDLVRVLTKMGAMPALRLVNMWSITELSTPCKT